MFNVRNYKEFWLNLRIVSYIFGTMCVWFLPLSSPEPYRGDFLEYVPSSLSRFCSIEIQSRPDNFIVFD